MYVTNYKLVFTIFFIWKYDILPSCFAAGLQKLDQRTHLLTNEMIQTYLRLYSF
jgi:hypothetical protein